MAVDVLSFESSVAVYLKSKGYVRTLQHFVLESPYLLGRNAEEFDDDLSDRDFDQLAQDLKKNAGTYTMLSQAIHQMENAMTTMKFGLGLTRRRPNGTLTMQTRFYNSHHSTMAKPLQFAQIEQHSQPRQRQGQGTKPRRRHRRPQQSVVISSAPSAAAIPIEVANHPEATPIRQHFGNRVAVVKEVTNVTTPTRRQLFASPASKRKTPNPKHQMTPVVERDLLDEALKQCSISPSGWDRRVSGSALPEQLATAINNALVNVGVPIESGERNGPPVGAEEANGGGSDDGGGCGEVEDEGEGDGDSGTDAVVSGAMYQIGTNPNLFQSLEQLFAPEYNDPDVSAMEDDINRFSDLHTPEPRGLDDDFDSPLALAFNHSTRSATTAHFDDTPRLVITPCKAAPHQRAILPKTVSVEKRLNEPPPEKSPTVRRLIVARPMLCIRGDRDADEEEPWRKKIRADEMPPSQSNFHVDVVLDQSKPPDLPNNLKDQTPKVAKRCSYSNYQQAESSTCAFTAVDQGNVNPAASSQSKRSEGANRFPSKEMLTPDRIDALMKRLHRKT